MPRRRQKLLSFNKTTTLLWTREKDTTTTTTTEREHYHRFDAIFERSDGQVVKSSSRQVVVKSSFITESFDCV